MQNRVAELEERCRFRRATLAKQRESERLGGGGPRGEDADAPRCWSAAAACAPAIQSSGLQPVVTERLYFGRNVAQTLGVTDSAWAVFVADVVTARLPEGFTFWTAEASGVAPMGEPFAEPSFVLEVVHPTRSAATEAAILAIIAEYKRRFKQESVLRVVSSGRASY